MIKPLALAMLAALGMAASSPVRAQHAANCGLADYRRDGGLMMRRYQWHAFDVVQGIAGATIARKVLKLPVLGAVTVTPAITLALHLNGARRGRYGYDWRDWAFDALLRSAPALPVISSSWQARTLSSAAFVAGYFAGACFASP